MATKIAITTVAFDGGIIHEGTRLEASDPLVKRFERFFADDTGTKEFREKYTAMWEPAIKTAATHPTAKAKMWRAKKRIRVDVDGGARTVAKGEVVEATDPIVQVTPKSFEAIEV
jgi:hypothetical protein